MDRSRVKEALQYSNDSFELWIISTELGPEMSQKRRQYDDDNFIVVPN